ncbi:protein BCCIP homolog [Physcomitrium patens]|uniref:Protein BCCIP homolog n=1 Tax=Physcomitrium patens TaxID=3218 RepID=A9T5H5_PHYPA|nr:protein BCCIP homolog [Physcomitrium patens]PNR27656.1 hypothetical protein PHYPA_029808 [Physcomitrium patens]|eukprot:XP_024365011.1 protein BCCIP homolog [Physcomitrella patens]
MAALGKRKAEKSPTPSSEEEEEEAGNGNEVTSGSEELDSDESTDPEDELNTSSDSEHSSQPSQEIVDVDFEYFDPKPNDFHGIKALLRTYLDDETWDISGFTDLILAQTTVGTVVKADEDESPIALLTALNIGRYQKCSCMVEIHKYLRVKSAHKVESALLEDFWGKYAREVALLISERLVNAPLELAPPLYQGLFEEILWATEDEPTQELRESFKIKHYLYLTKVFEEVTEEKSRDKEQRKKQKEESEATGQLIYIKPEDEILHELSSWSFTFPVTGDGAAANQTKGLQQLRLVMAVDAKHEEKFQAELKKLIE